MVINLSLRDVSSKLLLLVVLLLLLPTNEEMFLDLITTMILKILICPSKLPAFRLGCCLAFDVMADITISSNIRLVISNQYDCHDFVP